MEEVINKNVMDFSKTHDMIQTILIFLGALLIPTFLGELIMRVFGQESIAAQNSQIIIGSIVNTLLIVTAINLKGWKKIISLVTMPSIATILGGYVFKSASIYMVYMIPAIWIGNFIMIYSLKSLFVSKNKNYFLASLLGIFLKVSVIFASFLILNVIGIFPEKLFSTLQYAMSTIQLVTACIGATIAYGILKLETNKKNKETI